MLKTFYNLLVCRREVQNKQSRGHVGIYNTDYQNPPTSSLRRYKRTDARTSPQLFSNTIHNGKYSYESGKIFILWSFLS